MPMNMLSPVSSDTCRITAVNMLLNFHNMFIILDNSPVIGVQLHFRSFWKSTLHVAQVKVIDHPKKSFTDPPSYRSKLKTSIHFCFIDE